jgi:hypothetical protein
MNGLDFTDRQQVFLQGHRARTMAQMCVALYGWCGPEVLGEKPPMPTAHLAEFDREKHLRCPAALLLLSRSSISEFETPQHS